MKKYILLSLVIGVLLVSSCTSNKSDGMIPENNPSGDYLYVSSSKYYSSNDDLEYEGSSDGYMYVNWYSGNSTIDIDITPNIGYTYSIQGSNLEQHGDTTTFRISAQTITIGNSQFNVRGTNGVAVPNLGNYDGYYVQDKKIVYAFKSSNIENYESTETSTEGTKRN